MPASDRKKPARRAPQALAAKPVADKPVLFSKPVAKKTAGPGPVAGAKPVTKAAPVVQPKTVVAAAKPPAAKVRPEAKPVVTPAAPAVPVEKPPVAAAPAPAREAAPALAEVATLAASVTAVIPPEVLPKAVRGVADTGLAQARDAYATLKHSAETLSSSLNTSGEAAARGLKSFSTTMLEQMQTNTDATLGFLRAMAGVRTLSEAIELQARHARQQFDTVTAQAKTLAGIVNKTATETAEPVRKALDSSIRRAS